MAFLTTDATIADAPIDLAKRAVQAMHDSGFTPELPAEARQQLTQPYPEGANSVAKLTDLRSLLWSSIDNQESRDLDQVEWAELLPDKAIRLCVGIADVDCWVKQNTPIDAYALRSTTSVYTGVATFPMLPESLSTDRTSLNAGQDRAAIVVELMVETDGHVSHVAITRALLHNYAKFDYESVGEWLEEQSAVPPAVAAVPGLKEQVLLQAEAARRLLEHRRANGTLELETPEVVPVLDKDGHILRLEAPRSNNAERLIENLMVAANVAIAEFLAAQGIPTIARVVHPPGRWSRIAALAAERGTTLPETPDARALATFLARERVDHPSEYTDLSLAVVKLLGAGEYVLAQPSEPAGHFGLAAPRYSHATAPNRSYSDLVIQRQLKAALAGENSPYDATALAEIATRCTERQSAARTVERTMRKTISGVFLQAHIGDTFRAVVTAVKQKGVFVRLLTPPAVGVEGRLVAGEEGMDVGNAIAVRLTAVDMAHGYIDFARVSDEPGSST